MKHASIHVSHNKLAFFLHGVSGLLTPSFRPACGNSETWPSNKPTSPCWGPLTRREQSNSKTLGTGTTGDSTTNIQHMDHHFLGHAIPTTPQPYNAHNEIREDGRSNASQHTTRHDTDRLQFPEHTREEHEGVDNTRKTNTNTRCTQTTTRTRRHTSPRNNVTLFSNRLSDDHHRRATLCIPYISHYTVQRSLRPGHVTPYRCNLLPFPPAPPLATSLVSAIQTQPQAATAAGPKPTNHHR